VNLLFEEKALLQATSSTLLNMAKNLYIYLKFCSHIKCASGAVVEAWAADSKDVVSPPACAL
jgi:hypothetical protein